MAFVERVMQWGSELGDTEPPDFEPNSRWISIHLTYAAIVEIIEGHITVAQFKAAISSTPADDVDIDAIVANAPSQPAQRSIYAQRIHSVFLMANARFAPYDTPAEVRTMLGI